MGFKDNDGVAVFSMIHFRGSSFWFLRLRCYGGIVRKDWLLAIDEYIRQFFWYKILKLKILKIQNLENSKSRKLKIPKTQNLENSKSRKFKISKIQNPENSKSRKTQNTENLKILSIFWFPYFRDFVTMPFCTPSRGALRILVP